VPQAGSTRKAKQQFNPLNNFTQGFIDLGQLSNPSSTTHNGNVPLLQNPSVSSYTAKPDKPLVVKRGNLSTTKPYIGNKTLRGSSQIKPIVSESPNYTTTPWIEQSISSSSKNNT
jgi:hypothetical protein